MLFFEEDVQDTWLKYCLNKFKRCFTDDTTLAQALNARASIAYEDTARTGGISPVEIDDAFESIDTSLTRQYQVADKARHGNILKNSLGEDLFSKLHFTDSEILLYEAAWFYSVSDDSYMLRLNHEDPLKEYVLYVEPNAFDGSLDYSLQDNLALHTGSISHDMLESAGINIDFTLPKREFESQLLLYFPKFLLIISQQSPHQINSEMLHGFAQHYLQALYQDELLNESQSLEEIINEKKAFIEKAQKKITELMYEKLYERMLGVLSGFLDDPNISEALKIKVRGAIEQILPPADGFKHAVLRCIRIRDAVKEYSHKQIEAYQRVKENVALKVQEQGLPQALQMACEAVLAQVEHAEETQALSLIAPELIKMLGEIDIKIQHETDAARERIERRLESLQPFLAHPLVDEEHKNFIRKAIRDGDRALSLGEAIVIVDKLEEMTGEITFSMLEVKLKYTAALDALITQLMEAETPSQKNQDVFNDNLITEDQLDNTPLKEIKEKTQAMEQAAALQRGINLDDKFGSHEQKSSDDNNHPEVPPVSGKKR
jgi:hypothetical protein